MYYIDVQAVIDAANKRKPLSNVTRAVIASDLGTSKQSLTNYQSGRVPQVVNHIGYFQELSGLPLDQILKKSDQ